MSRIDLSNLRRLKFCLASPLRKKNKAEDNAYV